MLKPNAFRGVDIVSDFGRMNFESETSALTVELVEDRMPQRGKTYVTDYGSTGGNEIKEIPDRQTGKAVDDRNIEAFGRAPHFSSIRSPIGVALQNFPWLDWERKHRRPNHRSDRRRTDREAVRNREKL